MFLLCIKSYRAEMAFSLLLISGETFSGNGGSSDERGTYSRRRLLGRRRHLGRGGGRCQCGSTSPRATSRRTPGRSERGSEKPSMPPSPRFRQAKREKPSKLRSFAFFLRPF